MDDKKKVPAVSHATRGGQSAMSNMNPQKSDQKSSNPPKFKGIALEDNGPDTWGLKNLERYEE